MPFPATRLRRLRKTGVLRDMVRETELAASHLVYPLFVELGTDSRTPIEAMPGVERLSISHAVEEAGVTLELLAKTAISHAAAGADAVAPSDMMDGRVAALRSQLDAEGHEGTPIVAYS